MGEFNLGWILQQLADGTQKLRYVCAGRAAAGALNSMRCCCRSGLPSRASLCLRGPGARLCSTNQSARLPAAPEAHFAVYCPCVEGLD